MIGLARERHAKNLWTERRSAQKPRARHRPRRGRPGALRRRTRARAPRGRASRSRRRRCCSARRATARSSSSSSARRDIPFVKFGGLQVPRGGARQGRAVDPALGREPARAGSRAFARCTCCRASARRRRRGCSTRSRRRPSRWPRWPRSRPPAAAADGWPALVALVARAAPRDGGVAGGVRPRRRWYEPQLERLYDDAPARAGDLAQLAAIAATYRHARALPDRADARSAERHQRRGGRADARRRLPDPVDDPLGQGPGVEGGAGPQRRRRLHSVGPGHRNARRDRGGAAAALRRDDARHAITCTWCCRSASTSTARPRTATATSTRRAAASCPRRCCRSSTSARGRRPTRRARGHRRASAARGSAHRRRGADSRAVALNRAHRASAGLALPADRADECGPLYSAAKRRRAVR